MRRFFTGLAIGLIAGASSASIAASIAGDSGALIGWGVTLKGKEICADPYVSTMMHQIECDG